MPDFYFMTENFLKLPEDLPRDFELFQQIISNDKIVIERIISCGQKTPEGQWLEDDRDEWVMLIQGRSVISFQSGMSRELNPGDHLIIPKNSRHRVEKTSTDPACIWIAVYY